MCNYNYSLICHPDYTLNNNLLVSINDKKWKKQQQKLSSNNNKILSCCFNSLIKKNDSYNDNKQTQLYSFCNQNKNSALIAKSSLYNEKNNDNYDNNDNKNAFADKNYIIQNENFNLNHYKAITNQYSSASASSTNFKKIEEILNFKEDLIVGQNMQTENLKNLSNFSNKNYFENENSSSSCTMEIDTEAVDTISSEFSSYNFVGKKRNNFVMQQIGNYSNINTTNTNNNIDNKNNRNNSNSNCPSSNNFFLLKKMKISSRTSKEHNNHIDNNSYFALSNSQNLPNNNTDLSNDVKVETKFFQFESRIPLISNSFYNDVYLPK